MGLKLKIRDANQRLARKIYLTGLDTVDEISKRRRDFAAMRAKVCEAGADSAAAFQNGYEREGGLCLRQNPDEFASLCLRLIESRPFTNYLEIGSGNGASYFLWREVGFADVVCLDDGKHPRADEQKVILDQIPNLKRFTGDIHSPAAEAFLSQNLSDKLDVVFIDGEQSYTGVWRDIRLALKFARPGTFLALHKTIASEGVKKAWLECAKKMVLTPVAEYIGPLLPLGIGLGTVN